ncbi:MAG: hypothetical protein FRX49_04831 [Trebouxia sp. A1-2]|nr:MAG: hypothetical protein FRX49_04831 [Trebouxia sp. A1-2]
MTMKFFSGAGTETNAQTRCAPSEGPDRMSHASEPGCALRAEMTFDLCWRLMEPEMFPMYPKIQSLQQKAGHRVSGLADWNRPFCSFCFCVPAAAPLTVLDAASHPTAITDLRIRLNGNKVLMILSRFWLTAFGPWARRLRSRTASVPHRQHKYSADWLATNYVAEALQSLGAASILLRRLEPADTDCFSNITKL